MSHIPVHEIEVPGYLISPIKQLSGKVHYTEFGTPVPQEYWDQKPDFASIAAPIVRWLREHYSGCRIGLRLLGSMEHPGKSVDDLITIIQTLGHDRYDPHRMGDRYDNLEQKRIDIFVLAIEVGRAMGDEGEEQVQHALNSFFVFPLDSSLTPIRIDIAVVYDLDQLEVVAHRYVGRESEIKTDGYVFKHTDRKSEAVLDILKIL